MKMLETPRLILFSGLPGTGKTRISQALASHLKIPLFTKDRLQSRLRIQGLREENTIDGYLLILDLAEQQLALGISTILDGVFPFTEFRQKASQIATQHKALFRPIYCYCSDIELWKERITAREQNVPDWTPVGWDEVKRIQPEFLAWKKNTALPLDAADDFDQNLSKATAWIQS
jgi:predicted kinase